MIDWIGVGTGALWIVGLSIALAAIGFANAAAGQRQVSIRQVLQRGSFDRWIYFGLVLFSLGMTGNAATGWESALWFVLAILFGTQGWQAIKSKKNHS